MRAPSNARFGRLTSLFALGVLAFTPAVAAPLQSAPSAQGAVGAALGAPAQPKVGVTQAPASVLQATGEPAERSAQDAALDDAIASGDLRKALELGASPAEITRMVQASGTVRGPLATIDPSLARFIQLPNGAFGIGFSDPNGGYFMFRGNFGDYAPPGGTASLPTMEEQFGPPPPPPPPTAEQLALGQLVMSGGSAEQAAGAMIAGLAPGGPPFDPTTAQYLQGPNGQLALAVSSTDGRSRMVQIVPGAQGYPGLSSLPTMAQALPAAALPAAPAPARQAGQ